jgi:hypothetical protein
VCEFPKCPLGENEKGGLAPPLLYEMRLSLIRYRIGEERTARWYW